MTTPKSTLPRRVTARRHSPYQMTPDALRLSFYEVRRNAVPMSAHAVDRSDRAGRRHA
jgi:hypothetical protein